MNEPPIHRRVRGRRRRATQARPLPTEGMSDVDPAGLASIGPVAVRLVGSKASILRIVAVLDAVFTASDMSKFYPTESGGWRMYLTISNREAGA